MKFTPRVVGARIPKWIVMGPGKNQVTCLRCKKSKRLEIPAPIAAVILDVHAFGVRHLRCEERKK